MGRKGQKSNLCGWKVDIVCLLETKMESVYKLLRSIWGTPFVDLVHLDSFEHLVIYCCYRIE